MCLMRGGTSRGPFFRGSDLPSDPEIRDRVLLSVMGSPHPLQVDGVGGGHSLTSKAGIVSCSPAPEVDLDFEFAQLQPDASTVQTTANCGNMLAAVVPFAVEAGLIVPDSDSTEVTVRTTNTGLIATITVQTPKLSADGPRTVSYDGCTTIDGVSGSSSPVSILFVNTAGSIAPGLLPTGNRLDSLSLPNGDRIGATMIDNGQPLVLLRAHDLGLTGAEDLSDLTADSALADTLEHLRLSSAHMMGLGDVTDKNYPKMTLLAPPAQGGAIATRSFIPHTVHRSIGVLAALTVATASCMAGTVAFSLADPGDGESRTLEIEHPTGAFPVDLQILDNRVCRSGLTRTARLIMDGQVFVPKSVWAPVSAESATHKEGTQN
nr:4-oxalomesaconate tautomerase [Brevibacterium marinum]